MRKNADKIEIYKDEINIIEKKLFKIFCSLKQNTNISAYELNIIENELDTIFDFVDLFITEIDNSSNNYENFNKKKKILITLMILSIVTTIIPIIGLATFMSVVIFATNLLKKLNDEEKYFSGLIDLGKHELNTLTIELDNCLRIVNYIKNNRKKSLKDTLDNNFTKIESSRFELANYIINIFLNETFDVRAYNRLPEDFKKLIINILQDDLNTEEDYIINLITMAKRKIEEENMLYQTEINNITRKRQQKNITTKM